MRNSSQRVLALVVASCGLFACGTADLDEASPAIVQDAAKETATDSAQESSLDSSANDASTVDGSIGDGSSTDSTATDASPNDSSTPGDSSPPDAGPPTKKVNCQTGAFSPYLGDIHTHTSHSDGTEFPVDLFKKARDTVGLDFVIVTDHSSKLVDAEFATCKKSAASFTKNGSFVGDCGFEVAMPEPSRGHANVLFASDYFPYPDSLATFYQKLLACKGCLGQINHPASEKFPWENESYVSKSDSSLVLVETSGADKADAIAKYVSLLDKGWHFSPSNNSDTHSLEPGANGHRTGVFTSVLDLASIRLAMTQRRTFGGTAGNGASVALKAEGCWMGARLQGFTTVDFEVTASDAKTGFANIQLLSATGKVLHNYDCKDQKVCKLTKALPVNLSTTKYVFAVANRGDGKWMISSPIWIEKYE